MAIETVALPAARLASSQIAVAVEGGERSALLKHPMLGEVLVTYVLEQDAGHTIVAENPTSMYVRFEVDASDHTVGYVSSRGALFCEDVLPPHTRQLGTSRCQNPRPPHRPREPRARATRTRTRTHTRNA